MCVCVGWGWGGGGSAGEYARTPYHGGICLYLVVSVVMNP